MAKYWEGGENHFYLLVTSLYSQKPSTGNFDKVVGYKKINTADWNRKGKKYPISNKDNKHRIPKNEHKNDARLKIRKLIVIL